MLYPNISDYKNAIVIPESFATLGNLRPENGLLGDIYFSSGNFAVVFKMRDTQTGKLHAVKCFTREQERRTESLDNISRYLGALRSPYIVPYTFLKDKIWVNDADYPVLLMDWVDGVTLGEKVKALCATRDTEGLHRLTVAFAEMALWLLEQDWAHGDLKHDNIMVRPDDSLALVDYDGCFVPAMSGQNAREIGSPCYRHPKRTAQHFDRHIDDFSILVIFLSLRALSQNPDLFETHQNGENLLFSVADLAEPQGSVLFGQLRRSADTYMQGAVGLLDFSVAMGSMSVFGLREGVLRVFFEGFKEVLLPKRVILRCKIKINDSKYAFKAKYIPPPFKFPVIQKEKNETKGEIIIEVERNIKTLNLSYQRLITLPSEIGQLINLEELHLEGNQLTSLPVEIGQLINLKELHLEGNQLTSLPVEIGQLINLKELHLEGNQLTSLPVEIGQLINLKELHLEGNQLISLPVEIGQLTNLKVLHLERNQLTALPVEIDQLTNLEKLHFESNQLTNLPAQIIQLAHNLPALNLSKNKLLCLPNEIVQLTNLAELDLSYNQLKKLPDEILKLTNLKDLILSDNHLTSLPDEISKLTNLSWLDLSYNPLVNLPFKICQLTNLRGLVLHSTQIKRLPPEIGQLTNLEYLGLRFNDVKTLPKEISNLKKLKNLDIEKDYNFAMLNCKYLDGNYYELDFDDFDQYIGTKLRNDISDEELIECAEMGKEKTFEILIEEINLDLSQKNLVTISSEIQHLTNLTSLNLSDNFLLGLPNEIGFLTNLKSLDLCNNRLMSVPIEIKKLRHLEKLNLEMNYFSNDEEERIKKMLPKCKIYF